MFNSFNMQRILKHIFVFTLIFNVLFHEAYAAGLQFKSELQNFEIEIVAEGLSHPWGMVFLAEADLLITERTGKLRYIKNWQLLDDAISGLPEINEVNQGGLLGITLHPDFKNNHLVYLSYAGEERRKYGTEVLRGTLEGEHLANIEIIFKALPKQERGLHFGSRLVFAGDGSLFISLGDRGAKPSLGRGHPAQQLNSHLGSLIRIHDDGSVPSDNPYVGRPGYKPEIYTYGNRNMQGMALHPDTNQIWTHEHGPQGGDEINIMKSSINYGWPVITYGVNYGSGTKIGEGIFNRDMEQPIHKWVPSIAPSGMLFYTGNRFPQWKGNLFVGSLKFGHLIRLGITGDTINSEERLLNFEFGRIRDVTQGPDGNIYMLTDSSNGKLLRLSPID
ncbi:MAG: glucose/arabinose dehydrogenase [Gammaproteobacteria bacterium]|jgi:glucose/arabinose dehydrogenase